MNRIYVSKALREVLKWKDEAYREVAGLPVRKALEKRLRDAGRSARELDFYPPDPRGVVPAIVRARRCHRKSCRIIRQIWKRIGVSNV